MAKLKETAANENTELGPFESKRDKAIITLSKMSQSS